MSDHLHYNGSNPLLISMNKSSQLKLVPPKDASNPFTLDTNASSKLENNNK